MDFLLTNILQYDRALFVKINQVWVHPWLDVVMPIITDLHKNPVVKMAIIPVLLAYWIYRQRMRAVKTIVLGVTVDGQISNRPDRNLEDETALSQAFKEGTVEVTLTPDGPLLDGTIGQAVTSFTPVAALRLGGNWRQRVIRNIPLGVYTATARLVLPNGQARALRLRDDIRPTAHWQPSLSVTWKPGRDSSIPEQDRCS